MNKKLKVVQIVQGSHRGSVQLTETDKDGKPIIGAVVAVIQFGDPRDAAKFEHGKEYTVSLTPTK